jgi:hypothetical protein
MNHSKLDRREFTRLSLLSMLSGVAITITITGCGGGGSGSGSPTAPGGGNGDKSGAISANHGHAVTISSAQLTAGGQLSLTLRGSAGVPDHTHTVDLSAAEVVSIRDGARVSKVSSNEDLHVHNVTFN